MLTHRKIVSKLIRNRVLNNSQTRVKDILKLSNTRSYNISIRLYLNFSYLSYVKVILSELSKIISILYFFSSLLIKLQAIIWSHSTEYNRTKKKHVATCRGPCRLGKLNWFHLNKHSFLEFFIKFLEYSAPYQLGCICMHLIRN